MLNTLTEKFQKLFSSIAGKKKLTEENISDAVREVRLALLDADVNYGIASQFVKRVKEKALGEETAKSVSPDEQFIKIIHDELVALMGTEEAPLNLKEKPTVILLCGLQGSGKTTQCAKLAHFLKKQSKKVLLAACDLQRPAAILQLQKLGEQIDVPVFAQENEKKSVEVAKQALAHAKTGHFDVLIVDTAGRLHVDEELMQELQEIKAQVQPQEILFVASSATGQDAVKVAVEFDQKISITGSILTMLDGNSRAGAALSIREVTQKPLKFEGVGEKIADLQVFNPESMADRILGMGDVINLVKRAEEHMSEEESQKMEKKLRKASFTYDDYLKQMGMMKKMGSFSSLLKMLPGVSDFEEQIASSEQEFKQTESIILSMTQNEREEKVELIPSRRHRIAKGSGTSIDDVNRMAKNFKRFKQMSKEMPSIMKEMKGKEKFLWR